MTTRYVLQVDLDSHLSAVLGRVRVAGGHDSDASAVRALLVAASVVLPPSRSDIAAFLDAWERLCGSTGALTASAAIAMGPDALAPVLEALEGLGRALPRIPTAHVLGMALRRYVGRADRRGRALRGRPSTETKVMLWYVDSPRLPTPKA